MTGLLYSWEACTRVDLEGLPRLRQPEDFLELVRSVGTYVPGGSAIMFSLPRAAAYRGEYADGFESS